MDIAELKRYVDLVYDYSNMYRNKSAYEIVIALEGRSKGNHFVRIGGIVEGVGEDYGKLFLLPAEKIKKNHETKEPQPVQVKIVEKVVEKVVVKEVVKEVEPKPKPEKKDIAKVSDLSLDNVKLKRELRRLKKLLKEKGITDEGLEDGQDGSENG